MKLASEIFVIKALTLSINCLCECSANTSELSLVTHCDNPDHIGIGRTVIDRYLFKSNDQELFQHILTQTQIPSVYL